MSITPPGDAAQFAAWMREMERRMSAVETGRGGKFTSINEGGIEFVKSDGTVRMQLMHTGSDAFAFTVKDPADPDETAIGMGDVAGGGFVFFVKDQSDSGGALLIDTGDTLDDSGLRRPAWTSGWSVREAGDQRACTSAPFEAAWVSAVGAVYHDTVMGRVAMSADVGTTGEVRIKETSSGAVTSSKVISSGSSSVASFVWEHGHDLDVAECTFHIEIRRTSGAGSVYCRPDTELQFVSSAVHSTASSGGWI